MSLRTRLILAGVALTLIPLLIVSGFLWRQGRAVKATTEAAFAEVLSKELESRLAQTIHAADTMRQALEGQTDGLLRRLEADTADAGGIRFEPATTVAWNAINQFDRSTKALTLPTAFL